MGWRLRVPSCKANSSTYSSSVLLSMDAFVANLIFRFLFLENRSFNAEFFSYFGKLPRGLRLEVYRLSASDMVLLPISVLVKNSTITDITTNIYTVASI